MHNCRESAQSYWNGFWAYLWSDKFFMKCLMIQPLILFFIALYVISYGNPARVSKGFDPDRNLFHKSILIDQGCGYDLGYENFPYIYFVTPSEGYLSRTYCVAACPHIIDYNTDFTIQCKPNSLITACEQVPSPFNANNQVIYYDTFTYKNNICIPTTLYYYNQIQSACNPSSKHQIVHDLYYCRWVVLLAGSLISWIITQSMINNKRYVLMRIIDDYYREVTWTFLIGTLVCIGGAGIIYCKMAYTSYQIEENPQPTVNTFMVNAAYILQVSNNGSFTLNLFIGISLVILMFICTRLLYIHFDEIKVLFLILKLTDKFMEEKENKKLKQISFQLFFVLVALFGIHYFLLTYLLSCIDVNTAAGLEPFSQVDPTQAQLILVPFLCFLFFVESGFVLSCLEYVTIASITKWFHQLINPNQQQADDHVKEAVKELMTRIPQIAKASFLLLILTIPKILVDYIRDNFEKWFKKITFLETFYQKHLRSKEVVLYVEVSDRNCTADEAMEEVVKILEYEDNQDEFEKYALLGNIFNQVARAFIVMGVFVFFRVMFGIINYFQVTLYSNLAPTMFIALFAYFISSLYLIIYGISGQTMLYLLFQEKARRNDDQYEDLKKTIKGKDFESMTHFIEFAEGEVNEKKKQEEKQQQEKEEKLQQEQQVEIAPQTQTPSNGIFARCRRCW